MRPGLVFHFFPAFLSFRDYEPPTGLANLQCAHIWPGHKAVSLELSMHSCNLCGQWKLTFRMGLMYPSEKYQKNQAFVSGFYMLTKLVSLWLTHTLVLVLATTVLATGLLVTIGVRKHLRKSASRREDTLRSWFWRFQCTVSCSIAFGTVETYGIYKTDHQVAAMKKN